MDALKESDFSAYLAPDTDESDNEEESVSCRAQSLLSKALGVDLENDEEDEEEEGGEKMIKFVPNVERNMQRNRMEREREKEETVFEKYQREKRKKKRERQRQRKMNDGGIDEKVMDEDEEDPFAAWDRGDFDDKEEEVKEDEDDDEELKRRRKAELELLLVGSGAVVEKEETKKNKKRKKKGKKKRVRDDDEEKKAFDPNDNRFASVYDDPDFAIDRTHKRFKATPATGRTHGTRKNPQQSRGEKTRNVQERRSVERRRRRRGNEEFTHVNISSY